MVKNNSVSLLLFNTPHNQFSTLRDYVVNMPNFATRKERVGNKIKIINYKLFSIMKKFLLFSIAVCTLLVVGSSSCTKKDNTIAVTGVSLNKSTTTLLVGATEKLTVAITPDNATNKNVTWTTSDATKATVANDGTVTGVKAGTATITATTTDGSKATCIVTVNLASLVGTIWKGTNGIGDATLTFMNATAYTQISVAGPNTFTAIGTYTFANTTGIGHLTQTSLNEQPLTNSFDFTISGSTLTIGSTPYTLQ